MFCFVLICLNPWVWASEELIRSCAHLVSLLCSGSWQLPEERKKHSKSLSNFQVCSVPYFMSWPHLSLLHVCTGSLGQWGIGALGPLQSLLWMSPGLGQHKLVESLLTPYTWLISGTAWKIPLLKVICLPWKD